MTPEGGLQRRIPPQINHKSIGRPKNKVVSLIALVRVENLSVAVIRHDSVGILHCLRVALILQLIVFRARIGFICDQVFFDLWPTACTTRLC
jgi:hypothetical protein